jgi:hypothetical protein
MAELYRQTTVLCQELAIIVAEVKEARRDGRVSEEEARKLAEMIEDAYLRAEGIDAVEAEFEYRKKVERGKKLPPYLERRIREVDELAERSRSERNKNGRAEVQVYATEDRRVIEDR